MWLQIFHFAFASVIVNGSPHVSLLLVGLVCILWLAIGALISMTLGSYQLPETPLVQAQEPDAIAYQEAA